MKAYFKQPSVKLLKQTPDYLIEEIWRDTKCIDPNDSVDINDLLKDDLPTTSFKIFYFRITSSLLFRDLLFTIRPIIPWGQSMRVVPITVDNNSLDSIIESDPKSQFDIDLLEKVISDIKNNVPLDIAKKQVPLFTLTHYYLIIDLRSLVIFFYLLKHADVTLYNHYKSLFECELDRTLDFQNYRFKPFNIYKYFQNEEERVLPEYNFDYNETQFRLKVPVTFNIAAQFLRQHFNSMKSELWNLLQENTYKYFIGNPEGSNFKYHMISYGNSVYIKDLVSTRLCWFAQWDGKNSWDEILNFIMQNLNNNSIITWLPCKLKKEHCTFKNELDMRSKGYDSNIPCPILVNDPLNINKRIEIFGDDSIIMKKWKSEIQPLLEKEYGNKNNQ